MKDSNYDFGGHIEHDRDVNPSPYSPDEEMCLSPYGYLTAQLGWERGKSVYEGLRRLAIASSEEHDGVPALAFDVVGGRFVAIVVPDEDDT